MVPSVLTVQRDKCNDPIRCVLHTNTPLSYCCAFLPLPNSGHKSLPCLFLTTPHPSLNAPLGIPLQCLPLKVRTTVLQCPIWGVLLRAHLALALPTIVLPPYACSTRPTPLHIHAARARYETTCHGCNTVHLHTYAVDDHRPAGYLHACNLVRLAHTWYCAAPCIHSQSTHYQDTTAAAMKWLV